MQAMQFGYRKSSVDNTIPDGGAQAARRPYGKVNALRIGKPRRAHGRRPQAAGALPAPAPIQQLHHYAYRARDAEETRHFYEDILGLPLYHIIQSDYVPSTGEYCPYTHFFFRLQDGSFIAFFDLGDDQARALAQHAEVGQPHPSASTRCRRCRT